MGLTKVFVGNLSFKTNEADLASEFSSAGKVVSANIITRGPRSLGYGFVELESEEDALKAVQLMNKKVIDSREINVEIAKPREELKGNAGADDGGDRGRGRRGGRGGRGRGRGGRGRGGGDRGGNDRGGRRRPRNEGQGNEGGPSDGSRSSPPGRGGPRRGRGGRGRGGASAPRPDNSSRTPSTTTLFVANLPFSVTDAGLTALFKDHHAKAAHIVKNRNGRSKGFGFVEFENEDAQKAAFAATENLEVEGRKLLIKIALTDNNTNNASGGAEGGEIKNQAPAATEEKKPAEEKKAETKA